MWSLLLQKLFTVRLTLLTVWFRADMRKDVTDLGVSALLIVEKILGS